MPDSANPMHDIDSDASAGADEDEGDDTYQFCDLIDIVEATEFSDAYHAADNCSPYGNELDNFTRPQPLNSPNKRPRRHVHFA